MTTLRFSPYTPRQSEMLHNRPIHGSWGILKGNACLPLKPISLVTFLLGDKKVTPRSDQSHRFLLCVASKQPTCLIADVAAVRLNYK